MTRAICPLCAREHPEGGQSCEACGSALTLTACPYCDAINAIDAARCHQCAASLAPDAASIEMGTVAADASPPAPRTGAGAPPGIGTAPFASAAADATPIVFAERVEYAHRIFDEQRVSHEQRMATAPSPFETLPIEPHAVGRHDAQTMFGAPIARPNGRVRRNVHVGSGITLVFAVAAAAYFALDVPLVQRMANDTATWLGAHGLPPAYPGMAATPASGPQKSTPRPPERPHAASVDEQPSATTNSMQQEPVSSNDAPSPVEAAQEVARPTAPPAPARAQSQQRPHPRSTPPSGGSRDALATKRLIERDLGKFRQP